MLIFDNHYIYLFKNVNYIVISTYIQIHAITIFIYLFMLIKRALTSFRVYSLGTVILYVSLVLLFDNYILRRFNFGVLITRVELPLTKDNYSNFPPLVESMIFHCAFLPDHITYIVFSNTYLLPYTCMRIYNPLG